MSLVDKIRKARETCVPIDGRNWTIRRPTDEEMMVFRASGDGLMVAVRRFVINWELTELDLIPGGDGAKVKFDPELFSEWVADQPQVWEPLGTAILEAYKVHTDKRDAALKNS